MPQKAIYLHKQYSLVNGFVLRVDVSGRHFRILEWTGSTDILVEINGQSEQRFPAGVGVDISDFLEDDTFHSLQFRNDSGGTGTLQFATSYGKIDDSRVTISGELNADISTDAIETPVAVTVTDTAADVSITADSDQREIVLDNQSANDIWGGDANVDGDTSRGFRIPPMSKIILSTSAKLYFHAPAGNSVLSYMRMTKA